MLQPLDRVDTFDDLCQDMHQPGMGIRNRDQREHSSGHWEDSIPHYILIVNFKWKLLIDVVTAQYLRKP